MYSRHTHRFLYTLLLLSLFACTASRKISQVESLIKGLRLIGQYEIPYNFQFRNTTVGGLSGIDYDARRDQYYLICDDRSDKNPARYYVAKIHVSSQAIDSVAFTGVAYMRQPDGNLYPNSKQDPLRTPDPEAMRYDPKTNTLAWTSEGERILGATGNILEDPAVYFIDMVGKFIDSLGLPANLKMRTEAKGPRRNGTLEGICYADNYQTLYVSVEEPLFEDGPSADTQENNAYTRIYKFDVKTRQCMAQYAYKLSPVAYPAVPENAFKINGIPDILSLGKNKLLVIERSFSTGRLPCTIKLFVADLAGATDISNQSLLNPGSFVPATKSLLLNMDDLGIYTDNIEGVTFGPNLPNGHKTLLFIADNNFNPLEKAQVLLFEVLE
ncbi:MAG TPA: esterase-like activity of phytase family protein [Ferruginibacter sp.]|nr:esterase-like activity of phytase family protein [Ferruginibacter sp.]